MATHAFSIKSAVRYGWDNALRHWKLFAVLVLITFFLNSLQNALNRSGESSAADSPGNAAVVGILLLAVNLAQMVLGMGWIRVALKIRDGQTATYNDLTQVFPYFINYLFAAILYVLIVAAGMILLVVPGLIWMAMFGLFGFVVMDKNADPVSALKRSAELTRGAKGWLIVFGLALLGINILGAMALVIGLFITLPLSALAAAYVYRELVARAETHVTAPQQPPAVIPGGTPHPA